MGTYIGHRYLDHLPLDPPQTVIDFRTGPPLHQSQLQASLSGIPPTLPSDFHHLADIVPWLLYHHDDRRTRNHQLAQHLAAVPYTTDITTTAGLYMLGDCLEWLMQVASASQFTQPLLCRYLQQQSSTYPASAGGQVERLVAFLESQSLATDGSQTQRHNDLVTTLAIAIQQSLTYPENLALALNTIDVGVPTATLIGCLVGAWQGSAAMPSAWQLSWPDTAKQALYQAAEQLYRSWAGITTHIPATSATFEAFPLDL